MSDFTPDPKLYEILLRMVVETAINDCTKKPARSKTERYQGVNLNNAIISAHWLMSANEHQSGNSTKFSYREACDLLNVDWLIAQDQVRRLCNMRGVDIVALSRMPLPVPHKKSTGRPPGAKTKNRRNRSTKGRNGKNHR